MLDYAKDNFLFRFYDLTCPVTIMVITGQNMPVRADV